MQNINIIWLWQIIGILLQIQVDKPNMNFLLMVSVVCCLAHTTHAQLQDSTASMVYIIINDQYIIV